MNDKSLRYNLDTGRFESKRIAYTFNPGFHFCIPSREIQDFFLRSRNEFFIHDVYKGIIVLIFKNKSTIILFQ